MLLSLRIYQFGGPHVQENECADHATKFLRFNSEKLVLKTAKRNNKIKRKKKKKHHITKVNLGSQHKTDNNRGTLCYFTNFVFCSSRC
jgi:hypothetical protein